MVANEIDGAALPRTPLTGYGEGGSFRPREVGNTFRNGLSKAVEPKFVILGFADWGIV